MSFLYQLIKETKFSEKNVCPHCGQNHIIKYGKYKERQRYLCKYCGITFNDNTATFISGTHFPDKWQKYLEEMLKGSTLRAIAANLKISHVTAFYWRHKILKSLQNNEHPKLRGIIELLDFTVPYNSKGKMSHDLPGQLFPFENETGGSDLSQEDRIKIIFAQDRYCNYVAKVGSKNQSFESVLKTFAEEINSNDNKICSNYNQVVRRVCKKFNIDYIRGETHPQYGKLYHIRNIFTYKTKFIRWITAFRGVASHYFERYCNWYNVLFSNDFAVNEMFAENLARKCINYFNILTYGNVTN